MEVLSRVVEENKQQVDDERPETVWLQCLKCQTEFCRSVTESDSSLSHLDELRNDRKHMALTVIKIIIFRSWARPWKHRRTYSPARIFQGVVQTHATPSTLLISITAITIILAWLACGCRHRIVIKHNILLSHNSWDYTSWLILVVSLANIIYFNFFGSWFI